MPLEVWVMLEFRSGPHDWTKGRSRVHYAVFRKTYAESPYGQVTIRTHPSLNLTPEAAEPLLGDTVTILSRGELGDQVFVLMEIWRDGREQFEQLAARLVEAGFVRGQERSRKKYDHPDWQ